MKVFRDIFALKATIPSDLKEIRYRIQSEGYVEDNLAKENEILSSYHGHIAKEEEFQKQRFKTLWL